MRSSRFTIVAGHLLRRDHEEPAASGSDVKQRGSSQRCVRARARTKLPLSCRCLGMMLMLLLLTVAGKNAALGQATVGVQKFGAYDGFPDTIDLGSLGIRWDIPLFRKGGRGSGTALSFRLSSNVAWPTPYVTSPNGQQWNFYPGPGISFGVPETGTLTNKSATHQCRNMPGSGTYTDYVWTYVDGNGNSHLFAGTSRNVTDSNNTCADSNIVDTGLTAQASDGSGFLLQVGSLGYFPTSVTDPSGAIFFTSNWGGSTLQDSNGNILNVGFVPSGATNCAISNPCMDNRGNIIAYGVQDTVNTSIQFSGGGYNSDFSARNPLTISYFDDTGSSQTITLAYKMYNWSNITGSHPNGFLDSVTYPDGSAFHFTYLTDSSGNLIYNGPPAQSPVALAGITLPSGGVISYGYPQGVTATATINGCSWPYVPALTRTTSDGTTNYTQTITAVSGCPSGGSSYAQVTKPNGDQTTVYFIVPQHYAAVCGGNTCNNITFGWLPDTKTFETKRVEYAAGNLSTPLLTTMRCYNGATGDCTTSGVSEPVTQISVTTTLASGLSKKVVTQYTGVSLPTEIDEYDFGGSSPIRKTITSYATLGNNISDKPASIVVYDSAGNTAKKTTYAYDETTPAPMSLPSHTTISGSRGNPTTVTEYIDSSGDTRVTKYAYDDAGQVASVTDPNTKVTSYGYDTATDACRIKITRPSTGSVSHVSNFSYGPNSGLVTNSYDENNQLTTSGYDLMFRLSSVNYPGGGETTYSYTPSSTTTNVLQNPGTWMTSVENYDGYGRRAHSVGRDGSTTDFTYDSLGRLATASNPHFTYSSPTDGTTNYQYDALGRVTQTTKQDGSIATTQYDQTSANSPNGDCTLATDEAGKQRKTCLDGLSRLIEVDEPQASTGSMTNPYVTLYSYDALGNLLSVNQKGDGSQAARQRSFTYDSLSRLLTATNPESGQITYSYDANGNVLQKTSPAPNQTGSATQTISYCYDALNRVTGKAYSGQSCPLSSPVVTYSYDSGTNGIGHLTSLTDQPGSGSYSYDALGRIGGEQRTIAGIQKSLSYTYNLDNSVATLTYPSGAVVTYTPDAAGRMLSAVDYGNNINYVTGATYGPDNSLTGFLGGQSTTFAGITNSFSFNPRLQPVTMAAVAPDCTGSGCSASVTISGSLETAASTTGTPPPNAAPGSALSGYEDSAGLNHWLYEGSNDHLYEVYWNNNGNGRGYADTTVETGGPLAAQTTALSTYLDNSQVPHWIYEDGAQHMQLFWIYSGTWGSVDNTVFVGSPAMATGTALTSKEDTNCMQHWAFFGSNNHLYEMHHDAVNGCLGAGVQGYSDGTAATGAPPAAPGSAMSMYFDNSQVAHWIYEDGNQHIQLFWWLSSGSWGNVDVTTQTGAPVAAPGSALTSREDTNCMQHWAYFGTNNHLYEAHHSGANGCLGAGVQGYSDGTAATGAPPAAPGSAMSMYFDNSQVAHWIYEDSSQHIQLLWYAGGSWGHLDVTATAGSPPAAPGSALASGEDTNCLQRWLYFGSNQHLYEVHAQGNAGGGCAGNDVWGYSDVTAATPSEVIDSGTVSLSVGSFTATACFGSSSNPACTGKPVNDSPSQVASALATALNASGSPVTATASGATITMTWTASGAATPVSPLSTTHDNPALFPGPSFTSQAASFGGGTGGTLPVFSLTYNFNLGNGDNGNVIGITNNRDTTRSQSFTYDYLNRLTSAQNTGTNCNQMTVNGKTAYWGNGYGYDSWGNLLSKSVTKCSSEGLNMNADTSNRLHTLSGPDFQYDAAGNMTVNVAGPLAPQSFTYDAENRITGAAGDTYTYDADGNRVEKSNGSTGTIYWYMTPGIVAESDLSGNLKSEYVFFDGDRVARKDFSGNTTSVAYYFSDHLKTASVITNSAGVITEDEDYYPWGGELQFVNSDPNHYKFTGKERDGETQLDYFGARYYGDWVGRFMSADWAAKPEAVPYSDLHDPQSLNLYAYVRNNPATNIDPDGHECHTDPETGNTKCQVWATPLGPDGIDHATPRYAINRWIAQWNRRIDNFLAPAYTHFQNVLDFAQPCSGASVNYGFGTSKLSCGVVFPFPIASGVYDISTVGMTAEEQAAVIAYARRTNAWLEKNGPATVQSTSGSLRSEANAAARAERLDAARGGTPYSGQAGHVPDTAISGSASPPGGWLDMPGKSNSVVGGGLSSRIGQTITKISVDGKVP